MSTISSVNNYNISNPQITNKVAPINGENLADTAANESSFSSYIQESLANLNLKNPTSNPAPVVSGSEKTNSVEKSLSTFIQDLFELLSQKEAAQNPTPATQIQAGLEQAFSQGNTSSENDSTDNESSESNIPITLAAYTSDDTTTVGNIISNLQKLVDKLNLNDGSNTNQNEAAKLQSLQNSFQSILDAQGATTENPTSLANFLQTLAQNLQGQSPLGIIINTFS